MRVERSGIVSTELVLRIAVCDALILVAAAAVAWFLGWWTVAGFGRSLLWTGGAAVFCGGVAALVQLMLARASRTVAATSDRTGGMRSVLAQALGGEDPALRMFAIIFGSGALWAVTGAILSLVAG